MHIPTTFETRCALHSLVCGVPRLTLNDFLASQLVDSGDLLRELCRAKQKLYLQIDSTFKVEMAFIEAITGQRYGAPNLKDAWASYKYVHNASKSMAVRTRGHIHMQ